MWTEKIGAFSATIRDTGYCKRIPASLNPIKYYLSKEKGGSTTKFIELNAINEENVA
jgi:hypothetical protein